MRIFLSYVRSRAGLFWKTLAATAAVFVASLAFAECSTDSSIADDSISVSVTAVDDSKTAKKLAWLLDQATSPVLIRNSTSVLVQYTE